jgi:hypothetical protein
MHKFLFFLLSAVSVSTAQLPFITDFLSNPFRPADTLPILGILSDTAPHRASAWIKSDCSVPVIDVSYPESLCIYAVRASAGGMLHAAWGSLSADVSQLRESWNYRYSLNAGGVACRGEADFVNSFDRATVTYASPGLMDGWHFNASLSPGVRDDELNPGGLQNHGTLGAAAGVRLDRPGLDFRLGGEQVYNDDSYRNTLYEYAPGGLTGNDTFANMVLNDYRVVTSLQHYSAIARIAITPAIQAGGTINWREYATDYSYPLEDQATFAGEGGDGDLFSSFKLLGNRASTVQVSLEKMGYSGASQYQRSNGSYSTFIEGLNVCDRAEGVGINQQMINGPFSSLQLFAGFRHQQLDCPSFTADPVQYAVISYGNYNVEGNAAMRSLTAGIRHTCRSNRLKCENQLAYFCYSIRGTFSAQNTWTTEFYGDEELRIIHALSLDSRESLEFGPWSLTGFLVQTVPFAVLNPAAPPVSSESGEAGSHHVLFGLFHAGLDLGYMFGRHG